MSARNDGGPAFPIGGEDTREFKPKNDGEYLRLVSGMSLRDYYAAKAMQGLLARAFTKDERGRPFVEWVVEFSFEIADAMVKASSA